MEDHWTAGRVAEPAGVSVRTLHHYDEVGLVRPSARTAAEQRAVQCLRDDLGSGRWAERNSGLTDLDAADLGLRLLIA